MGVKKRGRGGNMKSTGNMPDTQPKPIPKRQQAGAAAKSVIEAMSGGSARSANGDKDRNIDEHPLSINHFLVVRYRDDSPRLAKILGVGGRTLETQQYYVHYLDFNRRMDEWVKVDRIVLLPSGANELGKERTAAEDLIHKQKHSVGIPAGAADATPHELVKSSSTDTLGSVGGPIRVREKGPGLRKGSLPPAASGPALKRANSNISAISLVSMKSDRSSRYSRNGDDDDDENGISEFENDDADAGESLGGDDAGGDDGDDHDNYDDENDDGDEEDEEDEDYYDGGDDDEDEVKAPTKQQHSRPQSGGRGNLMAAGANRPKTFSAASSPTTMSLEALNKSMIENRNHMFSLIGNSGGRSGGGAGGTAARGGGGGGGRGGGGGGRPEITNVEELEHDEHEGLDEDMLREHEELTKIKNFNNVMLGKHVMECWYFSPFPREYWMDAPVDCIYFCEFTLRFFSTKEELVRYQNKQPKALPRHPPGNEIYRDSVVSMFEVDGAVEKIYCQNLSYFAKLFLDHKTLELDVDVFLFYVLCTFDDRGYHPVGYFSKNKFSDAGYNLACILTFPSAQRQGYGRFLISFSYELSKKEGKVGSPEKPLSDLGNLSYRSYWANVILNVLRAFSGQQISVADICRMTSFVDTDVLLTLDMLELVYSIGDTDGPAGAHKTTKHVMLCAPAVLDELLKRYPPNGLQVDPDLLHWAPLYITDPKRDPWTIANMMQKIAAAQ